MSTSTALSLSRHHQELFADRILPIVERHARVVFRFLRLRHDDYADAVADCVAHAWQGYVDAMQTGKEPWLFPSMLATYAAQRTKVGRKVGKAMNAKEVYDAARAHRVELQHLSEQVLWQETLLDDRETPVPDQAAFRIDFPAWLETLSPRDRQMAESLATGETATALAQQFDLSRGRVTQIRQELMADWEAFTA